MISAVRGFLPFSGSTETAPSTGGETNSDNSLKGRVCPYWRMGAGVVMLAVCVVGVIACLILDCPYLSIVFGIGGCASGYAMYLGYEFHHLKTFGENNELLQKSNAELTTQVSTLTEQNEALETNLGSLKTSLEAISQENETFQASNGELVKTQGELKKSVQTLLKQVTTQEEKNKVQHDKLEEITGIFSTLGDHAGTNQAAFSEALSKLQSITGDEGGLAGLITQLDAFAKLISEEDMQALAQQHKQLEEKLESLKLENAKLKGSVEALEKTKKGLEDVHSGLRAEVGTLSGQVRTINDAVNSPLARQLSQSFSMAETPSSSPYPPPQKPSGEVEAH